MSEEPCWSCGGEVNSKGVPMSGVCKMECPVVDEYNHPLRPHWGFHTSGAGYDRYSCPRCLPWPG